MQSRPRSVSAGFPGCRNWPNRLAGAVCLCTFAGHLSPDLIYFTVVLSSIYHAKRYFWHTSRTRRIARGSLWGTSINLLREAFRISTLKLVPLMALEPRRSMAASVASAAPETIIGSAVAIVFLLCLLVDGSYLPKLCPVWSPHGHATQSTNAAALRKTEPNKPA